MKEYRCRHCNWLLFKGDLSVATIEIKCRRGECKAMNVFELDKPKVVA